MRDLSVIANDSNPLAFFHSDVDILDDMWQEKVERHFREHTRCGLIGFGGATALGSPDIYRKRYQIWDLLRYNYYSRQKDWETHGKRLEKPMQVAVLDGFAMIFRRDAFNDMGGWQPALDAGLTFHCYDTWACCMMRRREWETWILPIECWHHGGGVSISREYHDWLHKQGIRGDSDVHATAHVVIYNEFRDVLPFSVGEK